VDHIALISKQNDAEGQAPHWALILGLSALLLSSMADAQQVAPHPDTTPSPSFTGLSIYTAAGLQSGSVYLDNVRVRNTTYTVNAPNYHSTGTPWLIGLNYTHVFKNNVSLGAQLDFFPVSKQFALSIAPGFQFNEKTLGYLKLGWVHAPSTVDQGPGRTPYSVDLNGLVVGLGAKYLFTKSLYGFLEVNVVQFQKLNFTSWQGNIPIEGSATTKAQNIMLGVGYRF
jgi:opacity protein-like surface antigen